MKSLFYTAIFMFSIGSFLGPVSYAKVSSQFGQIAEEGVFVFDKDGSLYDSLKVNKDLIFDHVGADGFEVYGPKGLINFLNRFEISYVTLTSIEGINILSDFSYPPRASYDYPSPEQIERELEDIHAQYPNLTELIEIGRSTQGRRLLVLKISNDPKVDQVKPEFKYISSMHGDEIVGRELMIRLIKDILSNYDSDSSMKSLVDSTEIFIMPSMNPDGSALRRRGNLNYIDLNRSFPDFSTWDNEDDPTDRPLETQAIMSFQKNRNFALSANFHGGAEVVSYPWDTLKERHPFDSLIQYISHDYADQVSYMKNSKYFRDGVTNGYDWYEVNNGMQDWSYYWYNDLQVTIELSGVKWADYSRIGYYYEQNKFAMLSYMKMIHMGAGFSFKDKKAHGQVIVYDVTNGENKDLGTFNFVHGEFYKVLMTGEYEFVIIQDAKVQRSIRVKVEKPEQQLSLNYKILD